MSNDDFRRELNNVFDDVSGPPSSGLRDRVRSGIAGAPEARSPYWIAGVAACVLTALIVGALYVANPLRRPIGPIPGGMPTPTASAQPFVCTQQDYVPTATPNAGAQSTALGKTNSETHTVPRSRVRGPPFRHGPRASRDRLSWSP